MMSCIRRTSAMSLVVVILLIVSLLTLHLPTACARHVVVLNPNNNGLDNRGNENLAKALASTDDDDLAANKVISERKLGAPNNKEGTKATVGATTTTTSAGSRPRTVEMRAAAKHGDAVTEMYDMLRRDYASRASRRRPINNGATPLQVNKKP